MNLKKTRTRETILSILSKAKFPLTCEEIFEESKKVGEFTLSTVYRSLDSFEKADIIKKEVGADKKSVYSINTSADKHVLVCVKCHKKVIISGCPYHEANKKISRDTGFQILDHNTEIFGVCPSCLKKEKKDDLSKLQKRK
jgi:Fur family transcriptional regulator, ferric uptake regulator